MVFSFFIDSKVNIIVIVYNYYYLYNRFICFNRVSEQIYPQMESTLACAESNSNVGQGMVDCVCVDCMWHLYSVWYYPI